MVAVLWYVVVVVARRRQGRLTAPSSRCHGYMYHQVVGVLQLDDITDMCSPAAIDRHRLHPLCAFIALRYPWLTHFLSRTTYHHKRVVHAGHEVID
jgi:hypothetical protein